jgi:hypothetical protein
VTKCFGYEPATVASNVAILDIGAYHSKSFTGHNLLAALPSSRASLDWAQNTLFPAAEAGERVVICLRSARYWGLESGREYEGTLFAPNVTRRGHMLMGDRGAIISAVKQRIEAVDRRQIDLTGGR